MLTEKRLRFCREYIKDGNGAAAAERAGFAKGSAKVTASRLLTDDNIQAELARLRAPLIEKAGITLEKHLTDLEALRDKAEAEKQFSAAISAEIARGKVAGLYVERHSPEDLSKMSDDELERLARGQSVKLKLA